MKLKKKEINFALSLFISVADDKHFYNTHFYHSVFGRKRMILKPFSRTLIASINAIILSVKHFVDWNKKRILLETLSAGVGFLMFLAVKTTSRVLAKF